MESIIDKLWTVGCIALSSLLGFFMYVVKKGNDEVGMVKEEHARTRCEVSATSMLVAELKEDVKEIKDILKKDNDELKRILMRLARRKP